MNYEKLNKPVTYAFSLLDKFLKARMLDDINREMLDNILAARIAVKVSTVQSIATMKLFGLYYARNTAARASSKAINLAFSARSLSIGLD